MSSDRLLFLDTETTTGWHKGVSITEVVELGWVLTENGEVIEEGQSLTSSIIPINSYTESLIEISNDMIKGAPEIHDYAAEMVAKSQGAIVIGHNTRYDIRVLQESIERRGHHSTPWYLEFSNRQKLDTMTLFHTVMPNAPNRKLVTAMSYAGLDPGLKKHRALPDAQFTKEVFMWMWPMLQKIYKVVTVEDLSLVLRGEKPKNGQMSLI